MDLPEIVTDTAAQRWSRRRFMAGVAGVAALGSFATGCRSDAIKAHMLAAPVEPAGGASASASATATAAGVDADLISQRYGLKPFGWYRITAGLALLAYLALA